MKTAAPALVITDDVLPKELEADAEDHPVEGVDDSRRVCLADWFTVTAIDTHFKVT